MDHRLGDPSAVGSMLQRDSYFQLVIGIASDATIYCPATWRPTAPHDSTAAKNRQLEHIGRSQESSTERCPERSRGLVSAVAGSATGLGAHPVI